MPDYGDLDAGLDADRRLALSYVPPSDWPSVAALWALDAALGAVLAGRREPMVGRIKLAWWREALERLDREPPPAQPVLEALAASVLPRGISGVELSGLEEGWAILVEPGPLAPADLDAYAVNRGGRLFRQTARLLGAESSPEVEQAGRGWALADLARHSREPEEAEAAFEATGAVLPDFRWPPRLRPLGMLAALARRDVDRGATRLEPAGAPARMWRMLRHRFTGH